MAVRSVATSPAPQAGSQHDLWIGKGQVLTFKIDRDCKQFPPDQGHCGEMNRMIQGLARAAKAVVYQAENDTDDASFLLQPLDDIADAIVLLSQLSEAVRYESVDKENGHDR